MTTFEGKQNISTFGRGPSKSGGSENLKINLEILEGERNFEHQLLGRGQTAAGLESC